MDLMHLPLLWYFVDLGRVAGTYTLGILGVIVCFAFCLTSWYQIMKESD